MLSGKGCGIPTSNLEKAFKDAGDDERLKWTIIKDGDIIPVLLLDDVLSELDSNRQNYLLNSIAKIQTVITCTGLEEFVKNRFCINKIFQVINGNVYEKESVEEI